MSSLDRSGSKLTEEDLIRNYKGDDDINMDQDAVFHMIPKSVDVENELPNLAKLSRLIRNQPDKPILFTDGLVGALLDNTPYFITSPNCRYIPQPPLGSTRDIYRREDARYGPDDPLCWPQPFNLNYPFMASIMKKPTTGTWEEAIMWLNLGESHVVQGVVRPDILAPLSQQLEAQKVRASVFLKNNQIQSNVHNLFAELNATISVCLSQITTMPMTLRDLQLGLTEIQRSFLVIQAVMDYQKEVVECSIDEPPRTVDDKKLGAFVWNDRDAQMLYRAGLPVFFIRPNQQFSRQVIRRVVKFRRPLPPIVALAPAIPPYAPIITTQAGSDSKYGAMRNTSIQCFKTQSPFENLHIPNAYASSYVPSQGCIMAPAASPPSVSIAASSSGACPRSFSSRNQTKPARGWTKKVSTHPSKTQRDIFADLPDSFITPAVITAWVDVNLTIKREGVRQQKRTTVLPDPGLFFGVEESSRQNLFLHMWNHIRPAWIDAVQHGRAPQSMETWRKFLAYQPLEAGAVPVITAKNKAHFDARTLLETTLKEYDPNLSIMPTTTETPFDPILARWLIRELCMVNFRSELTYLDSLLDATRPQPSPGVTIAELEVQQAQHTRTRTSLITGALGDDHLLPHDQLDLGITSTNWVERYAALKFFWSVLDTWRGPKPITWSRGIEMDLSQLAAHGAEWERKLVEFYVQTAYSTLGFPPSLPRRL